MRLKNKVALITGGCSGIGKATSLLFAEEGAQVVLADINAEDGEALVSQIKEKGGTAVYVYTDVCKASDCKYMISVAENTFGRLDILFNNAGIMHSEDNNAQKTDEDVWDLTMSINAKGVFLGCKYGVPALQRAGGGSIINTASFVAFLGACRHSGHEDRQ